MALRLSTLSSERAELVERLAQIGRVLSLQAIVTWSIRGLAVGLAIDCLWLAGGRLLPYAIRPHLLLIAPAALALGLGIAAGLRPPAQPAVARRADRQLQLKERIVTAVELRQHPASSPLTALQLQDAVDHLRRFDPLDTFPVRLPGRDLNVVLGLAALAVLLIITPNPMEQTLRQREQVRTTIKQEAERISKLADELATLEEADELVDVQEFLRRAAQVIDERALNPQDAMAALASLEQRLLAQQDQNVGEMEDALAALAGALASEAATRDLGTSLAKSDYRQAARELKRLGDEASGLSASERAKIARALKQAGNRASRANQALAQALIQGGEALEQGLSAEAAQALAEASSQLDSSSNRLRSSAQRERALSQLQQSRGAINRSLQVAQQRSNSRGRNQAGASGSGEDDDDFGGFGGDDEMGSGDRPGGSSAGTGQGSGNEGIYDPLLTIGRPEVLPGSTDFDPNELYGNPYASDPDFNEAQVGYRDVYAKYQERATQTLQSTYIPAGLKDLVKDYFSSLAPNK